MTTTEPKDKSNIGGIRLLVIGDVHLGTRPSSLPDDLADMGVSASELTPESALSSAVDFAIEREVDAVLFAGDVVESTNARFEALRPLEDAVERLSKAGIPVLAVVGNHDVEALPRLAIRIDGLSIIGRGGVWESHFIKKDGQPVVEILGWSFPEQQVKRSPVADLIRSPIVPQFPGLRRLGLLHADLDAPGGNYAPVSSKELLTAGVDAWLLGHIHKPTLADSFARMDPIPHGYLGSLVGLDASETGPHGPWLISVDNGLMNARHIMIAPLRWEHLDVRIGESESIEDTADSILNEAERLVQRIHDTGHSPSLLGVRVHIVGRTLNFEGIQKYVDGEKWRTLWRDIGSTVVFVDKVYNHTELAVDLEELAKGEDPPALLARKLLSISRRDHGGMAIVEAARSKLKVLAGDSNWAPLNDTRDSIDPLADDVLAATLVQAGTTALYAMLRQGQLVQAAPGETA